MKKNKMMELQEKIKQLEQETASYLNEIRELLTNRPKYKDLKMISYFTYSTNISHEKEQDSMIIGTYHIQNIGNKTITNPYICLKISRNSPFQFSGKYINKKTNLSLNTTDAWERLNDQTDKEDYWLKPIRTNTIAPSKILLFSNFQLKWLPKESYSGSIMGFTYCDEFKEGIPALNQLNISGNY